MVKKKKREGDPAWSPTHPVNYSVSHSSTCKPQALTSDDSDTDYIVFESDDISEQPCVWSDDSDTDYIVFESDDISEQPCVWSDDSDSDSEDIIDSGAADSSDVPTLVINIQRTVFRSTHVRFSDEIITHMVEIEDRKGYWTEDRFRFQQRCASVQDAISFIFEEVHRRKMRLIVNMSDTLRILPYSNGECGLPLATEGRCGAPPRLPSPVIDNPTAQSSTSIFSNISRGHTTIMRPIGTCRS
ncbi:hypothetical protein [carnivorous sponge associated iridovirus]|nr:hypothetical protein [carnivorous sponge associated iridovirus]